MSSSTSADPTSYIARQSRAESAALTAVGGGRVTDFDVSDERDHRYEVEVTLENGRDIDVTLDSDFVVLTLNDVRH